MRFNTVMNYLAALPTSSQLLIGASALFWATSGSGLRPMVSVLDSAKHYEETHTRHRKRWFRASKGNSYPSFIACRPELSRQVSLPSIMTHGLSKSTDEFSDVTSISAVPRSLSIHRCSAWPSVFPSEGQLGFKDTVSSKHNSCVRTRHSDPYACVWS